MNEKYICYCGLYCENCAVRAKIDPAAKVLYKEMKAAGFEDIIQYIPGGNGFWPFLKEMAENGTCTSCKEGSGNPGCEVRKCAQNKGVEICASCDSYPCGHFNEFFNNYPLLEDDNELYREDGKEAWAKLQDARREKGFTYTDGDRG
jgi:hypothetical protein